MEAIALHVAESYGGAQFYISCGQVEITNGGSGTPGPLVAIPGVYTGYVSVSDVKPYICVLNFESQGTWYPDQHKLPHPHELHSARPSK